MLHCYAQAYGLGYAALRYFNAAGADPTARSARTTSPRRTSSRSRSGRAGAASAADVFGTDYPTPDGTAIRDYIHVVDLAEAHLLALAKLRDGRKALQPEPRHRARPLGREVIAAVER